MCLSFLRIRNTRPRRRARYIKGEQTIIENFGGRKEDALGHIVYNVSIIHSVQLSTQSQTAHFVRSHLVEEYKGRHAVVLVPIRNVNHIPSINSILSKSDTDS